MKKNLITHVIAGCALALAISGPGHALLIPEIEPNDSLETAQLIEAPLHFTIDGSRTFDDPSDDFFSFHVPLPGILRIGSSSNDAFADSIMGLFGGGGLLASNDDANDMTSVSAIEYLVRPGFTGLYTIGFSGFNPGLIACGDGVDACYDTDDDFYFDRFVAGGGAGGSTGWDYGITVSLVTQVVSEPSPLLLSAAALTLLGGMRRKAGLGSSRALPDA